MMKERLPDIRINAKNIILHIHVLCTCGKWQFQYTQPSSKFKRPYNNRLHKQKMPIKFTNTQHDRTARFKMPKALNQ